MVTSVQPLKDHRQLKCLALSYTPVSDLSPLSSCPNLTTLELNGVLMQDIASLSAIKQLATLALDDTSVNSLSELSCLPNLRSLSLRGARIKDASDILALRQVAELDLTGSSLSGDEIRLVAKSLPNCKVIWH